MVLLGDEAQVETHSQSVWMSPMELLRDVGHVESHFDPFGDGVSVAAR